MKKLCIYFFFQRSNPSKDEFFQVLYDKNDLVFYKDLQIMLYEKKSNGLFETPALFSKKYKCDVRNGDSETVAVNLNKKEVFEHFPQIELVAMEEIIKRKKYKMKKESDYIALFAQSIIRLSAL